MSFENEAELNKFINQFAPPPPPAEKRSGLGEIWNQFKAGALIDTPRMIGKGMQYVSSPGDSLYNTGQKLVEDTDAIASLPDFKPSDNTDRPVVNALSRGARMIPQSIAPALATGTVLSGAGLPAVAATIAGAAASAIPAGLAQAQESYEKGLKKHNLSPEQAASMPDDPRIQEIKDAARMTGGIEFLGETAGGALAGRFVGIGGKAAGALAGKILNHGEQTAAQAVLKSFTNPQTAARFGLDLAGTVAGETVTEMGQAAGQAAVEQTYGYDNTTPWDAAKDTIAPTLGMSALLAPFGIPARMAHSSRINQVATALQDPAAPYKVRAQAAEIIFDELSKVSPDAANNFALHSFDALHDATETGSAPYGLMLDDSVLEQHTPRSQQNQTEMGNPAALMPADSPNTEQTSETPETPANPEGSNAALQAEPSGAMSRAVAQVFPSVPPVTDTQRGLAPGATDLLREDSPAIQPEQPATTTTVPSMQSEDKIQETTTYQAPVVSADSLHGTLQHFIRSGIEKTGQSGQEFQVWENPQKEYISKALSAYLQPAAQQGLVSQDQQGAFIVNTDQGALRILPPTEPKGNYRVEYHSPESAFTPMAETEQSASHEPASDFNSQAITPPPATSTIDTKADEAAISPISKKVVEEAFPKQAITQDDNGFTVSLKNGSTVKITHAGEIHFNTGEAEAAYSRPISATERPVASFQKLDRDAVITLTEQGAGEIHHETFHSAFNLALNKNQRDLILKKFVTEEAAAAEYQRIRDSGTFGKQGAHMFLNTIHQFFSKIRSLFDQTHGIMSDVASGKVWEQTGNNSVAAPVMYSLKEKADTVTGIPATHKDQQGNFRSADEQVEKRWKAANGLDAGPGLLDRSKAFIHRMLSETQHFPELDMSNTDGKRTADILRRFESSAVAAKAKTAEHLHGLTATFGPKKMEIFTRKVILDDLMNEAGNGRQLPFGYTPETLKKDHSAITATAQAHPDIVAAIERRTEINRGLVMELVDNDLLPVESVLKPEALSRYQETGEYSADDINTGYFRHQVLEHANARRWAGLSTAGDVRNKTRGWQKGRQGSELDINTNFLEAEFEVFSQSLKELATKKTLDEVLKLNDLSSELKAKAKKEGVKDWKTLIPEGHTAWQPEKGSIFYRGQTMPEQIITKFIEENPAFAEVAEKFREVTILGGKKAEVIIPEGLARTLDGLGSGREEATLDTINKKLIGGWKVWTLLSPRRFLKYNINNMSGDMDVAIAADPAIILKHLPTAWRNAWNRRAGQTMTQDQIDMLDRGVIDAGISINEIPDINKLPGFQRLTEAERKQTLRQALQSGDLTKLAPPNLIAKYFDTVSSLTQLREGLIREAAYLRAKELLEQGKKIYWASKPEEIDALPDIKDKAAKLSRELVGDYGNLSAHGEKIRTRFIPFWSWMEINSPRYYRLFKNAATQGEAGSTAARMAAVGTRKLAGAAIGVAEKVLLTQILFASVSAFNHLVHPDEEDKLGDAGRKQMHIILGKTSSGKILTARFQGAFSDALSWFGLEDYPETWRKLQGDKMDAGDLAKKMLMATPNKLVNSTSPFFKLGAELLSEKSFYPEITKPMPIRDKKEHIARFFSLDEEYKALAGKPSRGYLDSLKKTLLYESDPGEQDYNSIRQLGFKFMEKNGKETFSGEPSARSNALYYYKQAIRFGDTDAAERYKQEYFQAGGRVGGMGKSIQRSQPLAMMPANMLMKFRSTLSAEEKEALKRSVEWYQKVYTGRH